MSISNTNIATKNLNLLTIFNALLETKSVTEAAKRLRMSQPNLSRALKVLRQEFDDPLFVRSTRGIVPTKRALELLGPLQEVMKSLDRVYSKTSFDIRKAKGTFVIGATDYIEFLLAPALAKIVELEAPGIILSFRPSQGFLPKAQMEKGECDLTVLVVRETIPPNFYKQDLFVDPYVCAVKQRHPILKSKLTLDRFLEFGHVMINPQGTMWAITDERLQKMNRQRRLVVATPNALSAVAAVAKSDMILTATKKFVEATMEFFPVETFNGPFEIEPIRIAQIWHERSHGDALHVWIRQKIKGLLS